MMPRPIRFDMIDAQIGEVLRSKTIAQRIAMVADANDTARLIAAAGIRHFHPEWSEERVEREVARRMLGAAD